MRSAGHKSSPKKAPLPVLLVGAPTAAMDRKHALLHQAGFEITRADSICHAEVYAESQYFEAAVYDEQLTPQEQVSLARVMRVRWPWIRLVRCGHSRLDIAEDSLFDCTAAAESLLPACLEKAIAG